MAETVNNSNAPLQPAAGRRAILPFNGALTHENSAELKQAVLAEIKRQRSEVILDFKHVVLLDSAALEILVDLHEIMQAQGKRLKLIRVQSLCMDILMATRILHTLNTFEDLHAAITHTP
jgi:anti-anti-sigma factor